MTLPITFPDWVPWWVPLLLLVVGALYGLAFILMPFSVFGVKSRLEVVEARLDEIQNEIRHLSLRLPAPSRSADFDSGYVAQPVAPRQVEPSAVRPPIPPAPHELPEEEDEEDMYDDRPAPPPHMRPVRGRAEAPPRVIRAEPRLDRRR
ncbi:MAG: hypothetical protein J0H67_10380 [Rhodospirillales bacterium]|nr:hypothetical protein [Rhodospirillales bacterium]MBN8899078.1 hypothetical protein [Rhodospirillales bacterium]MBN8903852.1 hypothetical protein [Rhodospirillales bacterium]